MQAFEHRNEIDLQYSPQRSDQGDDQQRCNQVFCFHVSSRFKPCVLNVDQRLPYCQLRSPPRREIAHYYGPG